MKKTIVVSFIVFMGLLIIRANGVTSEGFSLAFTVRDNSGVAREKWPARGGIPLPVGLVKKNEVSNLCVLDDEGREVPAQFDPFVLWWGKDRSVKWLLVDILANVPKNGESSYSIVKARGRSPSELRVIENEKVVTIVTGPLKAVVSKERGTILEEVFFDSNKDAEFSFDERMLKPDALNGSNAISDAQKVFYGEIHGYNMWGTGSGRISEYREEGTLLRHRYSSGFGKPDKVVVEARGPVRATLRIEGKHESENQEEGIREDGFYYYTVWLHFYLGKSFIEIEHSIDNNRMDYPFHVYRIKDLSLGFSLGPWVNEDCRFQFGGEKKDIGGRMSNNYKSLLQDSANLERWDLHKKISENRRTGEDLKSIPDYFYQAEWKIGPANFRGYKVLADKTWPTDSKTLGKGDHAPGWGDISGSNLGLSVCADSFWEECPKGIRLNNRRLEAVFFPDFSPEEFHIHTSTRKSHRIGLFFHSGRSRNQPISEKCRMFRFPLIIRSDPRWSARSAAYPRLLGLQKGSRGSGNHHWYPHFRWDKKIVTARWKTNGQYINFNGGGMHANYWSFFYDFLQTGSLFSWEKGRVHAKWASESIPWLIQDYILGPENTETHNRIVAYGPKRVYTHEGTTRVEGWVTPFTANTLAFSAPAKSHLDGEHLVHMWPFEWYYLSGSPLAYEGLMAVGNQAKYSVHRNFFKSTPKWHGKLHPAPSLDDIYYFDDEKHPNRKPWYFYTRIYASHLLSVAWTYAATGDTNCLFYAKWLVRRILYLQKLNGGPTGGEKRWDNIPPWQEAEIAVAAFEMFREIGDEELLDIMGSWLEWVCKEAYVKGKGMPHRFKRGTRATQFEHHWYPGVAAPLCYVALGDPRALEITKEWASAKLPHVDAGNFLQHPAGQSASYVLTYLKEAKKDLIPPEPIEDLRAEGIDNGELTLTWTAPRDTGEGSDGFVKRYWIKYSNIPIINQPVFPSDLGNKIGFYHADNTDGEPEPSKAGSKEVFRLKFILPHSAYGAKERLEIKDLRYGKYFFVAKSWDEAGNLSAMSNVAEVKIN